MCRRFLLAQLAGLFWLSASAMAAAETLNITNGEWPPFTSATLKQGGPLSRLVAEAFALEGIAVSYGYFPWKRSYLYAKSGQWDGSIGWAPTPEHQQDFYLSQPVIFVDKALFHLKSTPFDWNSIDDLGRWRVGAAAGYSYGSDWDRAVSEGRLRVENVAIDQQNLDKLLLKRIDVAAMEIEVATYLARTNLLPQDAVRLTYHPRLIMQTPICLVLSRHLANAHDLIKRFDHGLQRLKDSGRYGQFVAELKQDREVFGHRDLSNADGR